MNPLLIFIRRYGTLTFTLLYKNHISNNYINKINIFSGQALCGTCRDETHRAKMFSQHDVIHMSKKTKELHRKVSKAFTTLDVSSHKIVITN